MRHAKRLHYTLLSKKLKIMESGLYIIYAIIIATVILPFVLLIRGSKKREQKLRNALQSEAAKSNYKLDKIDTHGVYALGLDQTQQVLMFYKSTSENAKVQVVDLKTVQSCNASKVTRMVKGSGSQHEVIDQILLSFKYRNIKELSHIELYNNEDEKALSDELEVAQKWEVNINEILNIKHETKTADHPENVSVSMS